MTSVLVAAAVTIVYATSPSSRVSLTPVMVTVWATFQFAVVKVRLAGRTVPSVASLGGLWQRREPLRDVALDAPARAGTLLFVGGFGLGLLIASAFSAFFWWWAVGAVLFGTALVLAVVIARGGVKGGQKG